MAQFGRPSADTYNADLWVDEAAGGTNIWDGIDEVSFSDADYIESPTAPTSDVYVTKLTTLEDPLSSTGHVVRARAGKDAAGGATITLTGELRQAYVNEGTPGTLIATCFNAVTLGDSIAALSDYTLSGAEADAITDYTNLYLRFVANQA